MQCYFKMDTSFSRNFEGAPSKFNPKGQLQESLQAKSKNVELLTVLSVRLDPIIKKNLQ